GGGEGASAASPDGGSPQRGASGGLAGGNAASTHPPECFRPDHGGGIGGGIRQQYRDARAPRAAAPPARRGLNSPDGAEGEDEPRGQANCHAGGAPALVLPVRARR